MVIARSRWNHVLTRQRVNDDGHFQIVSNSIPMCHCLTGIACIQCHLAPTLGFNLSSRRQLMAIRVLSINCWLITCYLADTRRCDWPACCRSVGPS